MEQQLADALTSGMAAPIIGAALVILAWLAGKLRHGMSLAEQVKAAAENAWPGLLAGISTAGVALVVGSHYTVAIASGVTVLLALTNFKLPAGPKKTAKAAAKKTSATLLVMAFCLTMTGCGTLLPYLVKGAQLTQWLGGLVDTVAAQVQRVDPDPTLKGELTQWLEDIRAAIVLYDDALMLAESAHDGRVDDARKALLDLWDHGQPLLERAGLLDGAGDLLGSPGGPALDLPTRAELEARLP